MNEFRSLDALPAMKDQAPCRDTFPALYRRWLIGCAVGALFLPRPRGKLARFLYLHDVAPIPQA